MKQLKMVDFEQYRGQFDAQYENPRWHSGLPALEVALGIRRIYGRGELKHDPYVLTKARMLEYALENIRVAYNDFDSFATVCERTNEITKISFERTTIISEQILGPEEWSRKCEDQSSGYFDSKVDLSHTSPDWDALLNLGIPGIIARAEEKQRIAPSPFCEAVIITFNAMKKLLLRLAEAAEAQGRPDTAEMVSFLTGHAPETLQQALELGMVYREVQEMEGELVRSMGIFDRQYLPFYEHDLACGILTERSAEELLLIYFSRCHAQSRGLFVGVPYCFGGRLPDGHDGCNALTGAALQAFRRLKKVDPKFSLRVNGETPKEILELAFSCVKEGTSAILFVNEDMVRRTFLRNGKDPEDLANFVPIGCYEPAIMGKELCCSMTGTINMAKALESLMDPSFAPRDFPDVMDRYLTILRTGMVTMMDRINRLEQHWSEINPATAISGTMTECMERGIDASAGGTKYRSSGIMCAGISTVTDALAAVEFLVFDRKLVSFQELCSILKADWRDHEHLRLTALKRAPKWGTGDDRADRIAVSVVNDVADTIEKYPNAKGGHFQMGLWSIDWCMSYGKCTGATPDGRHAGDPISKNTSSTIGCDTEGAAGLIGSVTKLDHTRFADGSVLDMMLPVSSVTGQAGTEFMENLFLTFCRKGGAFMQFNILSPQEMRAAQIEPDKYRNLQIRLCGWNVRFIDLGREMQDCLIREAESKGA